MKVVVSRLERRMAFSPTTGLQETPASLGLEFTPLTVTTADGETLQAWWLENPAARVEIVLFHGNSGNLSDSLPFIASARRQGHSVLAFDYRGYGNSTGSPSEEGLYRDAEAIVNEFWARYHKAGRRVIYWGRSLGCAVGAYATRHRAPAAVIMESGFPDTASLVSESVLLSGLTIFGSYRFPAAELMRGFEGPVLVLHGDEDSIIPLASSRHLFERLPVTSKTLQIIAGADHDSVVEWAEFWGPINAFLRAGL